MPLTKYTILLGLIFFVMLWVACEAAINQDSEKLNLPETIDFSLHVKPILSDRCFTCHGPDKNTVKGGLSLHSPEGAFAALGESKDHYAIIPNDTANSTLIDRIFSADKNEQMPPPESNLSLSSYEKQILSRWISQGAEYKPHWSFIPPEQVEIPNTSGNEVIGNAIDNFIIAKLKDLDFEPSEQASPEKLLRRVHFDLTGLPPTPAQIDNFVKNPSKERYKFLVDSMLNHMDHAELMAAEWMDISRYADTHGYQDDFERSMWPWRDWVINAFKENTPYNEFVTVQLAGDLIPNGGLLEKLATGFNRNHKITAEGGVIPEEYRVEYVEDRVQTFGTAFLGLSVECARCHDHKYDPISQKNHFELFSFFNNVDEDGLTEMFDLAPKPSVTITEKEVSSLLSFINLEKSKEKEVKVMVMEEMKHPRQAFVLNRGVYDQPTTAVFPNTPEAILAFPEEFSKDRLGLANWLFHEDNPLTARVVVNRLWQRFFGNGIVKTSYDFGNQGDLPSHPELLDYLALELQENQWDLNHIVKLIVSSNTYKQSTETTEEIRAKDPDNTYLARAPRIRLPSELIRDQILSISGLLNKEVGGPSVKPYQPEGIWEETTGGGGGSTSSYTQSEGEDLYRKSLYTFWKRTVPPPSMMTFDSSSRDLCTVKRQETNTPLQALILLNDPQIIEAARATAVHISDSIAQLDEQISYAFRLATSRRPDTEEIKMLSDFYADMRMQIESGEIVLEEYLNIGQYALKADQITIEIGALALTIHTIFNLDETINRG